MPPVKPLVPFPVENKVVRPQEQSLERINRFAKCPVEEFRITAHDTVSGLEDELQGPELVATPLLSNVGSIGKVRRLIAHGKRPDANSQFLVQLYVEFHSAI